MNKELVILLDLCADAYKYFSEKKRGASAIAFFFLRKIRDLMNLTDVNAVLDQLKSLKEREYAASLTAEWQEKTGGAGTDEFSSIIFVVSGLFDLYENFESKDFNILEMTDDIYQLALDSINLYETLKKGGA